MSSWFILNYSDFYTEQAGSQCHSVLSVFDLILIFSSLLFCFIFSSSEMWKARSPMDWLEATKRPDFKFKRCLMLDRSSLAWHQPSHPNFLSARSFLAAAWYSVLQPALLLLYRTKHLPIFWSAWQNHWSMIMQNTTSIQSTIILYHIAQEGKNIWEKKQNYIGFITLNYVMLYHQQWQYEGLHTTDPAGIAIQNIRETR